MYRTGTWLSARTREKESKKEKEYSRAALTTRWAQNCRTDRPYYCIEHITFGAGGTKLRHCFVPSIIHLPWLGGPTGGELGAGTIGKSAVETGKPMPHGVHPTVRKGKTIEAFDSIVLDDAEHEPTTRWSRLQELPSLLFFPSWSRAGFTRLLSIGRLIVFVWRNILWCGVCNKEQPPSIFWFEGESVDRNVETYRISGEREGKLWF